MMRSLFSGISGLKVHQTKMDVIANNVSNVNTIGYKSSRVTFSDFFSQSVSGASGANASTGRGGTNPMQIGLGASIASIDVNMNAGMGQRTDKNFDLLIEGSGFFIVGDNSGTYFTRAGAFQTDAQGNLETSGGLLVYGWDVDANGTPIRDVVKPIQITGDKVYSPPQTTKNIDLVGNFNSADTGTPIVSNMQFFDSLGNSYTVDTKYVYNETATPPGWDMFIGDRVYPNGSKKDAISIDYATGKVTIPGAKTIDPDTAVNFASKAGTIVFNEGGTVDMTNSKFDVPVGTDTGVFKLTIDSTKLEPLSTFGAAGDINIDFGGLTQFNAETDATSDAVDGYKAGSLSDLNVGLDGSLVATYSNGETRVIYQIPVANFANPSGLQKAGNNLFQQTINSGTFDGIGTDITATGGTIKGGMLEMSNVDLASEFTEMITTQRGFQANSRTITTSDEMLQELVNLKR